MAVSPASRVPVPAVATPSSFTSSSAVLLSLVASISPTIADIGADGTDASTVVPSGVGAGPRRAGDGDAALGEQLGQLARRGLRRGRRPAADRR